VGTGTNSHSFSCQRHIWKKYPIQRLPKSNSGSGIKQIEFKLAGFNECQHFSVHQSGSVNTFRCTGAGRSTLFGAPERVGQHFSVHWRVSVNTCRCTKGIPTQEIGGVVAGEFAETELL